MKCPKKIKTLLALNNALNEGSFCVIYDFDKIIIYCKKEFEKMYVQDTSYLMEKDCLFTSPDKEWLATNFDMFDCVEDHTCLLTGDGK